MSKFSAVMVGINNYKNAPLKGCVNDIVIMRDILIKKYKVPAKKVRLVLNERATKQAIIERLEWLVKNDAPNKLFYFSGHGAQIPTQSYNDSNYEPDCYDELLCPYDFDWNGTYILDNEIEDILSQLKDEHHLTMIIDSCHSGTIDKDLSNLSAIKSMPMPLDLKARISQVTLSSELLSKNIGIFDLDNAFKDLALEPVIEIRSSEKISKHNVSILTGCREDQTSADAYFSNRFQGALSYVMQGILLRYKDISMMDLRDMCESKLSLYGFSQVPQLIAKKTNFKKAFIQV